MSTSNLYLKELTAHDGNKDISNVGNNTLRQSVLVLSDCDDDQALKILSDPVSEQLNKEAVTVCHQAESLMKQISIQGFHKIKHHQKYNKHQFQDISQQSSINPNT